MKVVVIAIALALAGCSSKDATKDDEGEPSSVLDAMQAAIAKATGEQA